MRTLEWYFDFISPYSYLQLLEFTRLPEDLRTVYYPVLFAGILGHWGQKGPAEIAPKRRFIYRQLVWQARRQGVELRFPQAHPFNPLPLLRLCIALDSRPEVVLALFRYVWRDGHLPLEQPAWSQLTDTLGVDDVETRIGAPQVKKQLRDNANHAIERQVFGVPTCVVDGQLFWGADAFEFLLDYLQDPSLLDEPEFQRVSALPVAASRE